MRSGLLLLFGLVGPSVVTAQGTAFKTGEVTTGMTKQCTYNYLGSLYTITQAAVSLCPITVTAPTAQSVAPTPPPVYTAPKPRTITAFKTGEQTTGMTKQCYYNALGSMVTRTISAVALCPITIQTTTNP